MKDKEKVVSVCDMAKKLGVSKQTIYNRIRRGDFNVQEFARGTYHGFLIIVTDEDSEK